MGLPIHPTLQVLVVLAITLAAVVRAWMSHRTAVAQERARTERLRTAIKGTDPLHRPDIVRACNGLESSSEPLDPASPSEPDERGE